MWILDRRRRLHAMTAAAIASSTAGRSRAGSARGPSTELSGLQGESGSAVPLRILIGFSARSASDDLMRLLQPELSSRLDREVQIELLPGELGVKAALQAISNPPDGNLLLVATFGTHAINPNLKPDVGYNPVTDFTPVSLVTRSPLVLGTRLSLGAQDVAGLVDLASRNELTYGSSGIGSAPYLAALLFQKQTGIRIVHRPYGDTRVLYLDLEAERLDLSFNNASTMLPLVRAGRLRALAVTTARRTAALPDVPTMAESGLQDYALSNWLGLVAPPGTPPEIVAVQEKALIGSLRAPAVSTELQSNGIEIVGGTSHDFANYISSEVDRWSWLRPQSTT